MMIHEKVKKKKLLNLFCWEPIPLVVVLEQNIVYFWESDRWRILHVSVWSCVIDQENEGVHITGTGRLNLIQTHSAQLLSKPRKW